MEKNPQQPVAPKKRSRAPFFLFLLLLIGVALSVVYFKPQWLGMAPSDATPIAAIAPAPALDDPRLSALSTEVLALRAQLSDTTTVNNTLREQLLSVTRRLGLLEDSVAGLDGRAVPATDQLALDEAQYLLALGLERQQLFGDIAATRRAYELADAQLSVVSDPRVALVRQGLAVEREILKRTEVIDSGAVAGQLEAITQRLSSLPQRYDPDSGTGRSRFLRLIDRYLVVRPRSAEGPLTYASATAAKQRVATDLGLARLALLERDAARFNAAIGFAIEGVRLNYDSDSAEVVATLAELQSLQGLTLRPTVDGLGATLDELKRYRATSVLGTPAAPSSLPAATPSAMPQTDAPATPVELEPATESVAPGAAPEAVDEAVDEDVEEVVESAEADA